MAFRNVPIRPVAAALIAGVGGVANCFFSSCSTTSRDEDDDEIRVSNKRYIPRFQAGSTNHLLRSTWPSSRTMCEGHETPTTKPDRFEQALAHHQTESDRFERALAHHRSLLPEYRKKWEYSANSIATTSTTIPSRSWPDNVPPDDDLSFLLEDVKYCDRSPPNSSRSEYCNRLRFRVASALVLQFDPSSQNRGMEMLRLLAESNFSDAMVFYGMCLNDGRAGIEPNAKDAVQWFKRCCELYQHPQAQYELGVALYTGEGIEENEEEAVLFFQLAADQNHPAASYMLGDCLLDGVGVMLDRALALEWLVLSSELGHRGARSRVMAVLEKKEGDDYGNFTDASRQTMVDTIASNNSDKLLMIQRKQTLLRKEGGASRDPTEMARRKTNVGNSRKE